MRDAEGRVAQRCFTLGRRLEYQMACQFTSWQMSAKMVEFLRLARTSRLSGESVGSNARRHVKIAGSTKVARVKINQNFEREKANGLDQQAHGRRVARRRR